MATAQQAKAFIAQIAPIIQAEAKRRGYAICSAVIAQACIESAYGQSKLAAKYHNYFGLKCGKSWKGKSVNMQTKEEYTVGTLTTIKDNFRVYDDMVSGVAGYYDFISTKRYSNLKDATSAKDYLEKIKADGYATSSTYVSTNMSVVLKYELDRYDDLTVDAPPETDSNPYQPPVRLLRNGSQGAAVKWLQWELTRQGLPVTIDGIFGQQTEDAVRRFQNANRLVCDGLVGPKTIAALIE